MKPRLLLALALVCLLLPSAAAQTQATTLDKLTVRISQQTSGVTVADRYEIIVDDVAALNASGGFPFAVDADAQVPSVTSDRAGNLRTLDPAHLRSVASDDAGFDTFRANLSAVHPELQNGDRIILTVTYQSTDTTHRGRVEVAAGQLVVYTTPTADREPESDELGSFNPTLNGNEQHAVRQNAPAGYTFGVRFVEAEMPAAGGTNLNPYLVGVLGLLVGFLVAWLIFKRAPRAKKFEKGGGMESSDMLEARRRTLMAALKELELAHDAKEIPDAAYAPLKEEYKAQTVRVLRSLEDKKDTPKV